MKGMNSISEQQGALFEQWKRATQGELILDGVVDEAKYSSSPRQLLFILKEANYPGSEGWDLKEHVAQGEWANTWNNITRWTRAIHALPEELPWESLSKIGREERVETLNKIAFMNLNKRTGGTGTANREAIEAAVQEDEGFIRKQIAIYGANYIICCGQGVADLTTSVVAPQPDWQVTKRGVWFVKLQRSRHLISYWHPQSRMPANLLCFHLADAIRELEAEDNR